MVIRTEIDPRKIAWHALHSMQRCQQAGSSERQAQQQQQQQQQQQAIAAFVLFGFKLPERAKPLLEGLSFARKQLYKEEGRQDLMFTVERSVEEYSEEEQQRFMSWKQQQQQQETDERAATAELASKTEPQSSSDLQVLKAIYTVRAYPCKPKASASRASRQRSNSSSSSSRRASVQAGS
jgi:hypothetical protein